MRRPLNESAIYSNKVVEVATNREITIHRAPIRLPTRFPLGDDGGGEGDEDPDRFFILRVFDCRSEEWKRFLVRGIDITETGLANENDFDSVEVSYTPCPDDPGPSL